MYLQVDDDDRWRVVAQLLEKLQPVKNRLECAVLVQTNKDAGELVNHLEVPDWGCRLLASRPRVPARITHLALRCFRFSVRRRTQRIASASGICGSPLGQFLPGENEWQSALREVQRDVYRRGFEAVAREWIDRLTPELDSLGAEVAAVSQLARQFDQVGSRDIDAFLRFIPAEISEAAGAAWCR